MVPATSGQQFHTAKVSSPSSGKNGSVELLRFLFTSVIILFHINLDLWDQGKVAAVAGGVPIAFFHHGNLGVELENTTIIKESTSKVYVAITGDRVALTDIRVR